MRSLLLVLALLLGGILLPGSVAAQLLDAKVISLEAARRMADAAEAEARRNRWNVAIAIVDAAGELILFHRLDGVQPASLDIAVQKARTAARFRRPTKALQDALENGRTALLALDGVLPLEGGIPVVVDGQTIGAIGVSGVTSQQDAQIAQAGVSALRR
ncbi:MAG TPA: heme-binding protein [Longimicrobiaceae bacterium]|nr:heme-binding protein [Longimicrobiaceae bacterium]